MKIKAILILSIILSFISLKAQLTPHVREGFYLSLGLGGSFLKINNNMTDSISRKIEIEGSAVNLDLKCGIPLNKNWILHGDLIMISAIKYNIADNGQNIKTSEDDSLNIEVYGGGLTYYFLSRNIFISGTVGVGWYALPSDSSAYKTQYGFSIDLDVGKEWWISKKWTLGLSLGVNYTRVTNETDMAHEKINGIAIGLSLVTTWNQLSL